MKEGKKNFIYQFEGHQFNNLHEVRNFQTIQAAKFQTPDKTHNIQTVAGLDIAYEGEIGYAAGVIMSMEDMQIISEETFVGSVSIPYIPTYLFLREVPLFLRVFEKFPKKPDIVIIDGHGIAHPQFAGSATIFGVLADVATIGVGKKPLRSFQYQPTEKQNKKYVYMDRKKVGIAYQHKKDWKEIYISPGNAVRIDTAFDIVSQLMTMESKIPLPQFKAHKLANKIKKLCSK